MVSYAKSILFFLLFVNLVIQLLQGSSYERFVRPVCGMILIILVIRPMLRFFGEEERVLFTAEQKLSLLFTQNDMAVETQEDGYVFTVLERYEAELTMQLEEMLQKEGLTVVFADFSIAAEEKEFGMIRGITVTATKRREKTGTNINIAPIVFERNQTKSAMSAREIGIRDKLSDFYRLEKDNIYVSIKEEEDG